MDDFDDNRRNRRYNEGSDTFGVHSTAGAVPVRNKKGEISMQKVKVQRYISGKRPEYARGKISDSDEDESDEEDFSTNRHRPSHRYHHQQQQQHHGHRHRADDDDEDDSEHEGLHQPSTSGTTSAANEDVNDPRLKRLRAAKSKKSEDENSDDDRISRHRRIHEPEVLSDGERDSDEDKDRDEDMESDESSSGEEDLDEEGIQRRRDLMRQRALARAQIGVGQEEIMDKEEEKSGSDEDDEEETSEEETTDSEEEEGARLKPVFVRKKDRLTVQEREREEARQRQAEREAALAAEQRRRETLRMVEEAVKKETTERKTQANDPAGLHDVATDDENEELEYEAWKLRELKRLKRDREERETMEREAAEIDRLRNMTEEERRMELKLNPKVVTNKAAKGKYKFLQKYYHRGVFFLDKEENVFTRDYSGATLEDKFDKTVLPKVMQVKNFGRSGRTKYTHLVDQDTTQFDSPWTQETSMNHKFQLNHAAGAKPVFERPSLKKKK